MTSATAFLGSRSFTAAQDIFNITSYQLCLIGLCDIDTFIAALSMSSRSSYSQREYDLISDAIKVKK